MSFQGVMSEKATDCTLLEKVRIPDSEGGWETRWVDGSSFVAAITHSSTIEALVAESEGMSSTFTVWTEKGFNLDYHDVFRRESDGQTFRVTSQGGDEKTPDSASEGMQVQHVNAERWELA